MVRSEWGARWPRVADAGSGGGGGAAGGKAPARQAASSEEERRRRQQQQDDEARRLREEREAAELAHKQQASQAGVPTSIEGFQKHPLYVLKRHITKYQVRA